MGPLEDVSYDAANSQTYDMIIFPKILKRSIFFIISNRESYEMSFFEFIIYDNSHNRSSWKKFVLNKVTKSNLKTWRWYSSSHSTSKTSALDTHAILHDINSLWPNDTLWWQRSGSTLAQVIACCLTAPSHYLNQGWLTISKVHWHSIEYNFTIDTSVTNHYN